VHGTTAAAGAPGMTAGAGQAIAATAHDRAGPVDHDAKKPQLPPTGLGPLRPHEEADAALWRVREDRTEKVDSLRASPLSARGRRLSTPRACANHPLARPGETGRGLSRMLPRSPFPLSMRSQWET
jgi:hypothetical protein